VVSSRALSRATPGGADPPGGPRSPRPADHGGEPSAAWLLGLGILVCALEVLAVEALVGAAAAGSPLAPIAVGVAAVILLAGVGWGITFRRYLEERRQGAFVAGERRALAESEARLQALLGAVSDAVCIVGPGGAVDFATAATEQVLGVRPEALVGRPITAPFRPEDALDITRLLSDAVGRSEPAGPIEVHPATPDGAERCLEARARDLSGVERIAGLVVTVADVTERRRLEVELDRGARFDPMTGLPNRRALLAQAGAQLAGGGPAGLGLIELDDLTAFDDRLGRGAGDLVLRRLADELQAMVGGEWLVARAGDRLLGVLAHGPDVARLVPVVERLLSRLAAPLETPAGAVSVRASGGVVTAEREQLDPEELLSRADLALRTARESGGQRVLPYDPDLGREALARLQLRADLSLALSRRQLFLVFQPTINLRTGRMSGVEALVRWRHPRRGVVLPSEFVPIAEESGLIVEVGRWVLEEACFQLVAWGRVVPNARDLSVAVNVSGRQLRHADLVSEVAAILERSGLAPGRLVLEITETVLLDDLVPTLATLRALKELGVRLAIDDFGTGYSSLSYLRELPVDVLKVDKSFVDPLECSADGRRLAANILRMAGDLGLTTVAEGIESATQAEALVAMSCDVGQGYYFARPLEVGQLLDRLAEEATAEPVAEETRRAAASS